MAGAAWYRQNTVTVTNGSAAVVGVSTMFTTQVSVGDLFTVDGTKFYEVLSVTDNTHLTLHDPYTGSTASTGYAIIRNFTTTTNAALAAQLTALLTSWQGREDQMRTWLAGNKLSGYRSNGTAASPAGNDPLAGYYPLSDAVGVTRYVACPERMKADATANYEEGVWTPTPTNLTVSGSPTYTGIYTKNGRIIDGTLRIQASGSTTSPNGTMNYFTGLPYTIGASGMAHAFNYTNGAFIGSAPVFPGIGLVLPTYTALADVMVVFSYTKA